MSGVVVMMNGKETMDTRFDIVFVKLAEAQAETADAVASYSQIAAEVDEISELRRIVMETTTDPYRSSYTTT